MPKAPHTRAYLESQGCGTPGCTESHDELWLSSQCHPGEPMQARFTKKDGLLTLFCHVCQRECGAVVVGNDPGRPH